MDSRKVCFILCANDDMYLEECIRYIQWLHVPEGIEVDILEIRDAVSMTAGYNEGMRSSEAKYKVYLHQDVFIKNRNFITDMLRIFQQDAGIGMIGLVGSERLPANGVMWSGNRVMYSSKQVPWESYQYDIEDGYWEVACVDGLLMATQYDVEWREDIFDGWDFYDISQSFEMRRHGFKVVVPVQNNEWYIHDDKVVVQLWNYNHNRQKFLTEYKDDLLKYGKPAPLVKLSPDYFCVEPARKQRWAAQVELLAEIDKFCGQYHIRYFADYRTLLGAVKYGGFAPDEDEICICMLREDYQRFCEIAHRGGTKGWYVGGPYIGDEWNAPTIRVVNGKQLSLDSHWRNKYHGCSTVVGMNILPLDTIPEEQAEAEVLKMAHGALSALAELLHRGNTLEELKADIESIEEYLNIKFKQEGNMVNQIMRMMDKIAGLYRGSTSYYVANMVRYSVNQEEIRLAGWYSESVLFPFETIQIPVPKGYEDVLKALYGDSE